MAFEEFEPKHIIDYNPNDIESLRAALQQYADIVLRGDAFEHDYCVVQFKPETAFVLLSDFKGYPDIHEFLEKQLSSCKPEENVIDNILTETLLFAFALKHPELKEDVKNTCKAFVTLARALNDSASMWITCEDPFAFNPLLMTAYVYPEFGYLLTAFYVPYWDDEHMPEPLYRIGDWVNAYGITYDTIKAFCYCDNNTARENMLGYDTLNGEYGKKPIYSEFDLIPYLRESDENYLQFLSLLAERYADIPYLPYTKDSFNPKTNPVEDIVLNMMFVTYPYDNWDDNFDKDDYLTKKFISKSAEEEIVEIKSYIEERLGRPILNYDVFKYNESLLHYDPNSYKPNTSDADPLTNWKEFICNALPQGEAVWDYIMENTDKSVLHSIEKTDLYKATYKGNFDLRDDLEEVCYSMARLWVNLNELLETLFENILTYHLEKGKTNSDCKQLLLRLTDVIFVLNGSEPFHDNSREYLTEDLEIITVADFNTRYKSPWHSEVKAILSSFGEDDDVVTREHIDRLKKLIYTNWSDVAEIFPSEYFSGEENSPSIADNDDGDYDDYINSENTFGKTEILVLATIILDYNQHDDFTKLVRAFVNQYAADLLWEDLLYRTEFPSKEEFKSYNEANSQFLYANQIEKIEEAETPLNQLKQYFYKGFIEDDGLQYSESKSQNMATEILLKYLEFDKYDISSHQKQVEWLNGVQCDTQKLLFVAHKCIQFNNLACTPALGRFLKIAFKFAPVRTAKYLAKTYKPQEYKTDTKENMHQMLDIFMQQGLSQEGYWAYFLDELATENTDDLTNLRYYKSLLSVLYDEESTIDPDGFISHLHEKHRKALNQGKKLLPYDLQRQILNDASKKLEKDFKDQYDQLLTGRFIRELKKEFRILDYPVYFKNRLASEGYYCDYIRWNLWHTVPEAYDKMMQTKVEKPDRIIGNDYKGKIYDIKEWIYIVIQKQGNEYIPILGNEELWYVQNGFSIDNINTAHVNLIIIDETCPDSYIQELQSYSKKEYKSSVINKTLEFFKDYKNEKKHDVENCFRYGINSFDFLRADNYYDVEIEEVFSRASVHIQSKILQLIGWVSYECLDMDLNLKQDDYLNLMLAYRVDKQAIFKYFLSKKAYPYVQRLSRKVDVTPFISDEKISDQMAVLSLLAVLPPYHPLLLKMRDHQKEKIRQHTQMLIERYKINDTSNALFHIQDYGIYRMLGTTTRDEESDITISQEPKHLKTTTEIKAELGMYFGFRFTATAPVFAPEVLVHKVVVKHPVQKENGEITYNTIQWTQNGYSASNIFLGWNFETEEELVPGEYRLTAMDMEGKFLVEKVFSVEVE